MPKRWAKLGGRFESCRFSAYGLYGVIRPPKIAKAEAKQTDTITMTKPKDESRLDRTSCLNLSDCAIVTTDSNSRVKKRVGYIRDEVSHNYTESKYYHDGNQNRIIVTENRLVSELT